MDATMTLAAAALTHPMQAAVRTRYGGPEVLTVMDVPRPVAGKGQVLIRVHAAAVTIGDHHVLTGTPYPIRLSPFGGLPGPKIKVPGSSLAGRVEAVGEGVTTFAIGDEVFGESSGGAFAEVVAAPVTTLARKPAGLTFEQAAAVPWAVTALQGLRAGGVTAGQRVLINGASGGVGTHAVQLAKAMGAHVTAVCSARNADLVRGLGADAVLDYAKEDFTAGEKFDVVFDLVGNRPVGECVNGLTPAGTYVACAGDGGNWLGPLPRILGMLLRGLFSKRKLKTFIGTPNAKDLAVLSGYVDAGQLRPVIEQVLPLTQAAQAFAHVGAGHARGQTVLKVG